MGIVVAVIGRSGAGKTTVAAQIAAGIQDRTGEVPELLGVSRFLAEAGPLQDVGPDGLDPREDMVRARVLRAISGHGNLVLDGFPRTPGQAAWLLGHLQAGRLVVVSLVNALARRNLVAREAGDPERLARAVAAAERQERQLARMSDLLADAAGPAGPVHMHAVVYNNDEKQIEDTMGKILDVGGASPPIVEVIGPGEEMPLRSGYATDAGFDLAVRFADGKAGLELAAGERAMLPTGVRVNIPPGFACRIVSRSSTFVKLGLEVYEGLIDCGYTGELMVAVINRSGRAARIEEGQRLAQVVFFPVVKPAFKRVSTFSHAARGDSGFGSTGA